jgi:hypothetical protein
MANRNISAMTGVLGLLRNSLVSAPTLIASGTWFTGGSSTTTKPHILIEPTGTTSTGWSTGGTGLGINCASGFAGNFFDIKTNGTTIFKVDAGGNGCTIYGNTVITNGDMLVQRNNGLYGLGAANDVLLYRDAADTLALRRTTNAQAFNIYNTYTDASNYERGFVRWSANALKIGVEAAGSGSTRVVHISNLPTSNPGAGILWNNAGTPAIGT